MSIIASVVNLVRLTTIGSLSHGASTCVYNTMDVMKCIAWVHLHI